jgi:hypothetical protein
MFTSQGPQKYTQIWIFGFKMNHLATPIEPLPFPRDRSVRNVIEKFFLVGLLPFPGLEGLALAFSTRLTNEKTAE